MPKVSCLLAIHRYDEYVPLAIQSILDQTFTDFELLILVNGDVGICEQIDERFCDSRIRLHYSPIQQLGHNLNKGLDIARGELIARMDGDDISLPQRFEEQVAELEANPEIVLVSSKSCYIDAEGSDEISGGFLPGFVHTKLWLKNAINHPAAMFRKQDIIDAGGYASIVAQDYDLWLRMDRKKPGFYKVLPTCHLKFRNHGHQTRGKIDGYATSAGLLLREFMIRRDVRFLLGSILFVLRGLFRPK